MSDIHAKQGGVDVTLKVPAYRPPTSGDVENKKCNECILGNLDEYGYGVLGITHDASCTKETCKEDQWYCAINNYQTVDNPKQFGIFNNGLIYKADAKCTTKDGKTKTADEMRGSFYNIQTCTPGPIHVSTDFESVWGKDSPCPGKAGEAQNQDTVSITAHGTNVCTLSWDPKTGAHQDSGESSPGVCTYSFSEGYVNVNSALDQAKDVSFKTCNGAYYLTDSSGTLPTDAKALWPISGGLGGATTCEGKESGYSVSGEVTFGN